jgi:hypothetical protein
MARYKHRNLTITRWLIPLPALLFAIWPTTVRATPVAGLNAVGYLISGLPTKSDIAYQQCGSELENNINRNFDGEPFQQCGNDNFMIHYTGAITIPENQTISFMVAADDGGTVKIGETAEFGTWNFKGCSWSARTSFALPAGTYPLDGWFFESGGYACYMLAWSINGAGWQIVPDSAFTTEPIATTTTTLNQNTTTLLPASTSTSTLPEETSTSTTTTQPTTTTTSSTTTTEVQTPPQTTTSTSTTTTSTSTTTIPSTTTTAIPIVQTPQPQIVETTQPPTTTTEPPTTTTTEPPTTTTQMATTTTVQETTSTIGLPDPSTSVPESIPVPSSAARTPPSETSTTTSQPPPQTLTPETSVEVVRSSSTTTLPEIKSAEPITDAKVEQILSVLADQAPAQIVATIQQVLTADITSDQAVSIASSAEVLAAVTEEQAEAIFEEIVVDELTAEVAEELVAVLNEAPTKVKKKFQETINVFAGVFDSFQMVGQTIPVGERRTLLAVSNTLVAVGASLRRRDR